ncbi:MAG: hypothetical protein JJE36_06415 [Coriobacteriia bacterium]|nr:hypothetical protein [Coriobacteriia bacterium]
MRKVIKAGVFLAVLAVMIGLASAIMKPPALSRQSWVGYLSEPKGTIDVIFAGTSHVYSAINPAIIDKTSQRDIRSYNLSGSGQSMALTYYTLKEAFRTQSPKIVAVESYRIIGEQRMADNNAMANFHYMPWSLNRIRALMDATNASMREAIAFPIVTYHSRWEELKASDFSILRKGADSYGNEIWTTKNNTDAPLRGYSMVKNTQTVQPLATKVDKIDTAAWNRNYPWLKKIAALCKKNDAHLILFWTPNAMEGQTTYIDAVRNELSKTYSNITYVDFNDLVASGEIKYDKHFADQTHTNVAGATVVSTRMGQIIGRLIQDGD